MHAKKVLPVQARIFLLAFMTCLLGELGGLQCRRYFRATQERGGKRHNKAPLSSLIYQDLCFPPPLSTHVSREGQTAAEGVVVSLSLPL